MAAQKDTITLAPAQDATKRSAIGGPVLVVYNEKAGSVRPGDRERLREILDDRSIEITDIVEDHFDDAALFTRAKSASAIIVLGGDGTAQAMAQSAPADAPPLILLPGGTLNMLPRALYGERPWPDALIAALEEGVETRLPLGRANGKAFFVAAMFGAPTLLARAREALREGQPLSALKRLRHAIKRITSRSVRARPDGGRIQKAAAIGVLCPSFDGEVEGSYLEWARLESAAIHDLIRIGARALQQNWRVDPAVDVHECRSGDIVSLGVVPAILDGEPTTFLSRVKITFEQHGPRVLSLAREARRRED